MDTASDTRLESLTTCDGRRRLRGPLFAVAAAIACALALPVHAGEGPQKRASKQESTGVASGFVVGAAAAGPVGAIIGAATGAWLGDRYHRQNVARATLDRELSESEAYGAELDAALDRTRDLELVVTFRTESSELEPASLVRIGRLAALADAVPGSTLRITGFADARGSQTYNMALSIARAEAVKQALESAGLDPTRVSLEAKGETSAQFAEVDVDGNALERRVEVRLMREGTPAVARTE